MRIAIIGGAGVFGARLADLLRRDGHTVILAGRRQKAVEAVAAKLGAQSLRLDRTGDLAALWAEHPDVVVDAAGPFQGYGADPYRLARGCIERGIAYLDFSDDADFTAGISALDDAAKANNVFALSGVSSVPGLSSAVVQELARDMDRIDLIDSAIVPGNRAPRGRAVIEAIVGQLGTSARVWRGGIWREQQAWSDVRPVRLGGGLRRRAYFLEVPDVRLFPAFFNARSVVFRAGLELRVMNWGLSALATLRRRWSFALTSRRVGLIRFLANLFYPFGSDRGGMRVRVIGQTPAGLIQRDWRLVAAAGQGPFIPAVIARAVIANHKQIAPGARPCLAEVTRAQAEAAMADLAVSVEQSEVEAQSLFNLALGKDWARLPAPLQRLSQIHDLETYSGTASVERGASPLAHLVAGVIGFPKAADSVPVTVTKERTARGETWLRDFGGKRFRSVFTPSPNPGRVFERFGLFRFEIALVVTGNAMEFRVRRGWFCGVQLARWMLPGSEAREYAERGVFRFDVALYLPLSRSLIVRYRGTLASDAP